MVFVSFKLSVDQKKKHPIIPAIYKVQQKLSFKLTFFKTYCHICISFISSMLK